MSCEWRKKIALYADDELELAAQEQLSGHLAGCNECATALAEQLALKKAVRVASHRYSAPPDLHSAVYRQLHPHARVSPWWKWGMSAACLLLLVALGIALFPKAGRTDPLMAELVDQHVVALASPNPVDVVSEDRHTVKPWFQGKLPFSFNLPELAGSPFKLIGGKLVYAQQNPGAELLYQAGQHKATVFVFPASQRKDEPPKKSHDLSFNVTSWQQGGLVFYLLTDAQNEADPLVGMFRDANKN